MSEISVVAGPASPDLAARVAKQLDAKLTIAELRVFSDGENKVRIAGKLSRKCVVIIQSTYPPVDTHLMQAFMLASGCVENGAQNVCAVIPYLSYARQDRAFLEGELVSIGLVARLLRASGVNNLITVDIHSQLAMSHFTSITIQNISAIPCLAEFAAKRMTIRSPVAVSPDLGGADRLSKFAELLGCDRLIMKKSRDRSTGEVNMQDRLDIDVSGRDAIVVDDMISSGASIIRAAEILQRKGARKVYAMCTHALLIGDAVKRIRAAGIHDVVATNSIPNEYSKVDLSPVIATALQSTFQSR